MAKGIQQTWQIEDLEMGIFLDYLGGSHVITWVLKSGRGRQRKGWNHEMSGFYLLLLSLKKEEEHRELRNMIASRSQKRKKMDCPLELFIKECSTTTKVHLVKAMVFTVVMYGCESWTIKKAEHLTIDAFELWCWRRLLRVPWTARRSNHSILKEISPGCSLEELMLKLKLQYFGHLIRRADSFEKNPDAGKD